MTTAPDKWTELILSETRAKIKEAVRVQSKNPNKKTVYIRPEDEETWERAQRLAKVLDISLSQLVLTALRHHVRHLESHLVLSEDLPVDFRSRG